MRDPVKSASIIGAYCTNEDADGCGVGQCTVLSGSGVYLWRRWNGLWVDDTVGNLEGYGASVGIDQASARVNRHRLGGQMGLKE